MRRGRAGREEEARLKQAHDAQLDRLGLVLGEEAAEGVEVGVLAVDLRDQVANLEPCRLARPVLVHRGHLVARDRDPQAAVDALERQRDIALLHLLHLRRRQLVVLVRAVLVALLILLRRRDAARETHMDVV